MKYYHSLKMPREMMDDAGFVEAMTKRNLSDLKRKFTKKSHKWIGPFEINIFDQNYDDFIKNRVTIRVVGNLYKAPRIAVKSLHDRNRNHLDRKYLRIHSRKYLSLPKGGVKLDA